jgi:arsenate reductase-like glutaredoxin family protein
MLKRAQFFFRNPCPEAEEAKSFLEENGVMVIERDISERPLSKKELRSILGYHNPKHYLDMTSATYQKKKLDAQLPSREELLELIADNPDLLRHPIVLSGRLMTIGNNRQQLRDMFQISVSNNGADEKKKAG